MHARIFFAPALMVQKAQSQHVHVRPWLGTPIDVVNADMGIPYPVNPTRDTADLVRQSVPMAFFRYSWITHIAALTFASRSAICFLLTGLSNFQFQFFDLLPHVLGALDVASKFVLPQFFLEPS